MGLSKGAPPCRGRKRRSASSCQAPGHGCGDRRWQFEGQEIFKRAVQGMVAAGERALARVGLTAADVDLVVPHQANLRIIEVVAKKARVSMERVYVKQRYGNMSAATVPVALCEALEEIKGATRRIATDAGFWRGLELLRTPGALGSQNGAAA
jgi:3-oxoacyl-[acyl-carrier-protein] synthase-3